MTESPNPPSDRVVSERLRLAIVSSGDGVWDWNLETDQVIYSDEWKRMLGYSPDELPNTFETWKTLVHPDDLSHAMEMVRRCVVGEEKQYALEHRLRCKDGAYRWILARGRIVERNAQGNPRRFIGTHTDISEFRRLRSELEKREERLRFAVEATSDGIWDWDLITNDAYFSPRWFTALGYEPGEYPSSLETWKKLTHPEDAQRAMTVIQEALARKGGYEVEFRMLPKWGGVCWVLGKGRVTALDAAGNPIRLSGTHTIITDRKEAEQRAVRLQEQLRLSQKMEAVGQLAGGVAHDFNNLLQAIIGFIDLARVETGGESPGAGSLDEATNAALRASKLTNQLLAFSRRRSIQSERLEMGEVVGSLLKMLKRLIGEHIRIDYSNPGSTVPLWADRGMIEQVVLNLSLNARDAMPEGGILTIDVAERVLSETISTVFGDVEAGTYVRLEVRDTGCGMSPEVRERMFEPFFTTKAVGKGTGLGLSVVYGIVRQHNGAIRVESEPGKGTSIEVLFPQPGENAVLEGEEIDAPIPGGHECILLAEDEQAVRNLTRQFLENAGYFVLAAQDGKEALELFNANASKVGLLLLDVVMPEIGGKGVYDKIRERKPGIPVLFISGYPRESHPPAMGLSDEGVSYLQKPFRESALLKLVREVLDAAGKES